MTLKNHRDHRLSLQGKGTHHLLLGWEALGTCRFYTLNLCHEMHMLDLTSDSKIKEST